MSWYLRLTIGLAGCMHAAPLPPDPPVGVMRRPGEEPPPPPRPAYVENLPHTFEVAKPAPVRTTTAENYPVRPWFPSVSGGPITVSWFSLKAGLVPEVIVPYSPQLTLRTALDLAAAPRPRRRVRLFRGTDTYLLPFAGISAGTLPDPVLAPGDAISVFAD